MAEKLLLGLFPEVTLAANAIEKLRQAGVSDDQVTVMSSIPYESEMLGRPRPPGGLNRIVILGAIVGVALALFLTVGIFLLYPLVQGGQPTVPIPPSLIIIFEVTMLGTMWSAFFGFLYLNKLPMFGRPVYDVRVSAGYIGVLAQVQEQSAPELHDIMQANGAHDVQEREARRQVNVGAWVRFLAAGGMGTAVIVVFLFLCWYDVIRIPFLSQMVNQNSIAYEQGPRLAAPAQAVPVQGPAVIAGQPASEPVPATTASLQRGQVLFGINCVLCHGQDGTGNGPIGGYFTPSPADLTGEYVKSLSDDAIFMTITEGRGVMLGLAENLSPADRWDVVNYVRSLEK